MATPTKPPYPEPVRRVMTLIYLMQEQNKIPGWWNKSDEEFFAWILKLEVEQVESIIQFLLDEGFIQPAGS